MTENEKMMLPLDILDKLSSNYGSIEIDLLLTDKSTDDINFIKDIISDLEKEGYIKVDNNIVYLIRGRMCARW